jgi:CheY-specific phosphatase CheX
MSVVISERARNGVQHFVEQAAHAALVANGAQCVMLSTDCANATEQSVAMLTVSSYGFRILMLLHFNDDAATRVHFGALSGAVGGASADERFVDIVKERGNLLCGALNRELAHFFPHIGMSTPCVLDRNAARHIDAVKPVWVHCYRAELSAAVALHLTLALCASTDLDFPFERRALVEPAAGELEMF